MTLSAPAAVMFEAECRPLAPDAPLVSHNRDYLQQAVVHVEELYLPRAVDYQVMVILPERLATAAASC